MAEKFDLTQYKKSKVIAEHLEAINKIVIVAIKGFELFEIYEVSRRILNTLRTEKRIIDAHLSVHRQIIKDKGKLKDE